MGQSTKVWNVGGEISWNVYRSGLVSSCLLLVKIVSLVRLCSFRCHSPQLEVCCQRTEGSSWPVLHGSQGGGRKSSGQARVCVTMVVGIDPALFPHFTCFSSYLEGQWIAEGRESICIYWTNLQLVLGSASSYFYPGEFKWSEESMQLWSGGSSRGRYQHWERVAPSSTFVVLWFWMIQSPPDGALISDKVSPCKCLFVCSSTREDNDPKKYRRDKMGSKQMKTTGEQRWYTFKKSFD